MSTTAIVNATTIASETMRSSEFAARVIPAFRPGDPLAAIWSSLRGVIPGALSARLLRAGELLDAVVARIRDVDVSVPVGRHAEGGVELSVAGAVTKIGRTKGVFALGAYQAIRLSRLPARVLPE